MKVSIFGSGAWGTAIALLMRDNGHVVTLWSRSEEKAEAILRSRENPLLSGVRIPNEIHITSDMEEATRGIGAAVVAVPSFAVRQTSEKLAGWLDESCVAICMSKGIEKDTSSLFTSILSSTLGENMPIASVSGPTHAEEVALRIPTACVSASVDLAVAERVQGLLMNESFRVYTSTDVVGVELGAALKNVIALSAGISDGLGLGDNTIATLMTRGLAEMAELSVKMGGRKETLAGLAGLGDLIVTSMSRHSRNRRAGVLIGKGMKAEEALAEVGAVVEGYYAARAAKALAEKVSVDMPICSEAYNVLFEGKSPYVAMKDLMSRRRKSEYSTGEERWVLGS
ncbi:MAG: NAD(P)-dependent glycerol-3-phosphate dehydrogenase [Oscillospiraceae bacterium]|nr:NAD(P)-dependent glycerol-3-phosphate dehydrogenase [Oscillospiraceae bacterium]